MLLWGAACLQSNVSVTPLGEYLAAARQDWHRVLSKIYSLGIYARHTVAQLVEALRYKPEGRGFDFQWFYWNFSLT
jgi:hypothetical protein